MKHLTNKMLALSLVMGLTAIPVLATNTNSQTPIIQEVQNDEPIVTQLSSTKDIPLPEKIGMPNPLITRANVEEASKAVQFTFVTPSLMPVNYKVDQIITIDNKLAEVFYMNNADEIVYRMAKLKAPTTTATNSKTEDNDISGDYTQYSQVGSIDINNLHINIKGNNNLIYLATWQDAQFTYSLHSTVGLTHTQVVGIIASIQNK